MSLSEKISTVTKSLEQEQKITFEELTKRIGYEGQAIITLILSLPFLLWIGIPGLSTVLGIFIMINGFRIATKRRIWIPRFLRKKEIRHKRWIKSLHVAEKIAKKMEKWIRPRGEFLHRHPGLQIVNGWVLAVTGFFLALPFPPGTNFTPAVTVALISLGILEEDGWMIFIGYITFFINVVLFVFLPILGIHLLRNSS